MIIKLIFSEKKIIICIVLLWVYVKTYLIRIKKDMKTSKRFFSYIFFFNGWNTLNLHIKI
jgi:hypothetical protein